MSMRWGWMTLAVLGVALLSGCSSTSTCNRDADATTVTSDVMGNNTWFSAPYHQPGEPVNGAPYAYFPPARTITFGTYSGRAAGNTTDASSPPPDRGVNFALPPLAAAN